MSKNNIKTKDGEGEQDGQHGNTFATSLPFVKYSISS